jgi:flagellar hook-associated protein 1 FlgK
MSDLLSLLSLGSAGIAAQNTGIAVASNNVANANTEGYSRQRVDLEALVGSPLVGGVRAGDPDRYQDALLGGRIRVADGALAMSQASAAVLADLEQRLAGGGATLTDELAGMFASFARAAASPTDTISRQEIVDRIQQVVHDIRRRSAELEAAHLELDLSIRQNAQQASALAQRLADTNLAIAKTNDPVMRDERDRLARELSQLVGGSARIDADGQMRFVLDGGAVLVDGQRAARLDATPDPTTGDTVLSVVDGNSRRDVTNAIGAGRLGAELQIRDGMLADARTSLDQLAYDLATSANAVHAANAGLDGVAGRPLFTPLAGVAGAAAALALDPAIEADPKKLALAAPGQGPGSNAGALALYQLANQPVAAGGKTLGNAAIDLVGVVASAAARATADAKRDQLVSDHLAGLRDSLAGVDIQEELTNLARFEHASAAMTRFVSTIDELLGDLIDRL